MSRCTAPLKGRCAILSPCDEHGCVPEVCHCGTREGYVPTAEVASLRAEVASLRAKVCQQEEDITRYQMTADALRAELDLRTREVFAKEETKAQLYRDLSAANATASALRAELEKARADRIVVWDETSEQFKSLCSRLEELEATAEREKKRADEAEAQAAQTALSLASALERKEQYGEIARAAEAQLKVMREALDGLGRAAHHLALATPDKRLRAELARAAEKARALASTEKSEGGGA